MYSEPNKLIGSDLTGRGSLTVNQEMIGSSPILPANYGYGFLWEGRRTVYAFAAGSTPVIVAKCLTTDRVAWSNE